MNYRKPIKYTFKLLIFPLLLLNSCGGDNEEKKSQEEYSNSWIDVRNNTGDTINECFAYKDAVNSGWTSKGYYKIAPYSEIRIDINNLDGKPYTGDFYISALIGDTTRNDLKQFCADSYLAFEILNADVIACKFKKGFFKHTITPGPNKVVINPY